MPQRETYRRGQRRPASRGRRSQRSRKKSFFRGIGSLLKALLTIALVLGLMGAAAGLFFVWRCIEKAPVITAGDLQPTGYATILYDRDGNEMQRLVMEGANREEAEFEEIPEDLINAFIAAEDASYWENPGIDLGGILRAAAGVLTGDSSAGGGSTITQQLIKNTIFNGGMERTFMERLERKVQEWYLAVALTGVVDKKDIMTNYLNTINLGTGTLGVKVAARRYFGKEIKDLTLSECAVLAGITKNPSRLNPITGAEANKERRDWILGRMKKLELIGEAEYEEAMADPVYERIQTVNQETAGGGQVYTYFVDEVIRRAQDALVEACGYTEADAQKLIYSGGLSIYTTQDSRLQAIVDEEINNPENYPSTKWAMEYRLSVSQADGSQKHYSQQDAQRWLEENGTQAEDGLYQEKEQLEAEAAQFREHILSQGGQVAGERLSAVPQPQISFVLLDQGTGQVRAMSGGRGEKTANLALNRATGALRQPGSTFKVLSAFAPALENGGATLATAFYDGPYSVGSKSFRNWYNQFTGYAGLRDGIVYSMNIVAVRAMMELLSPAEGVDFARQMGITTLTEADENPATALGGLTDGVTNLDMTAAYGAIANKGVYIEPTLFTKIVDHEGNVIYESRPESYRVLRETVAFLLTDAMREGMESHRRFASFTVNSLGTRAKVSGMSCAGKSGTTTSSKDIWFEGFTPYYTAGIWSGNDQSQVITGGTSYHKDIWKKIMDRAHEGLADPGFPQPDGIVTAQVCRKSGKLAVDGVCQADPRGNAVYTEYFEAGTEPVQFCDRHVSAALCQESGLLAGPYCPQGQSGVFMVIDAGEGESDDTQYALPPACGLHSSQGGETSGTGEEEQEEEDEVYIEEIGPGVIRKLE